MSAADLSRLEELVAKATPGPWRGDRIDGTIKYQLLGAGGAVVINQHDDDCGYQMRISGADAALIMEAVNALPTLLSLAKERDAAVARAEEARAVIEAVKVLAVRGDWPLHSTTNLNDDDEEIGGDICVICGAFDSAGLVEGHPHHDNCEWMDMVKAVRAHLARGDS